eukprot:3241310-Rhodomonas_salina.1
MIVRAESQSTGPGPGAGPGSRPGSPPNPSSKFTVPRFAQPRQTWVIPFKFHHSLGARVEYPGKGLEMGRDGARSRSAFAAVPRNVAGTTTSSKDSKLPNSAVPTVVVPW